MARSRTSGRRTDYGWSGNNFTRLAQTTGGSANSLADSEAPQTLMRCRGEILYRMDVAAAGDAGNLGFGIIILDNAALAAGAGSIPSPVTALDADWLWHGWGLCHSETGTQSDSLSSHIGRLVIDSKAMRRMKTNDNVVFVGDVVILSGTPTFDWQVGCRILVGS